MDYSEESQSESPAIRMGSPFAEGTAVALTIPRRHESPGEGVWRETAAAASLAACFLLAFLLACCSGFQGGYQRRIARDRYVASGIDFTASYALARHAIVA